MFPLLFLACFVVFACASYSDEPRDCSTGNLNIFSPVGSSHDWQFSKEIITVAGNGTGGYSGDNAPAPSAELSFPDGVCLDFEENIIIVDHYNNRIRKINKQGLITTVAGNGVRGYGGDNGPAESAELANPTGICFDFKGDMYIADYGNNVIRMVNRQGIITTIAGNGTRGYGGDNGPAESAELANPTGIATDYEGNIFISDSSNNRIRKVDPSGTISTVAGNGTPGYNGDNGPAIDAELYFPWGLCADFEGNIYCADYGNSRIRKIDKDGTITTIAGNGTHVYSGDQGPASDAGMNSPTGVCMDFRGNIYIADFGDNRIRKVNQQGIITTVAGNGTRGYSGDNGPATGAALNDPCGVAADFRGNIYIADFSNNRIREVIPSRPIPPTEEPSPTVLIPTQTPGPTAVATPTPSVNNTPTITSTKAPTPLPTPLPTPIPTICVLTVSVALSADYEANVTVDPPAMTVTNSTGTSFTYQSGTKVTLTINFINGGRMFNWEGDIWSYQNPLTITMNKNISETAYIAWPRTPSPTITLTPNITPSRTPTPSITPTPSPVVIVTPTRTITPMPTPITPTPTISSVTPTPGDPYYVFQVVTGNATNITATTATLSASVNMIKTGPNTQETSYEYDGIVMALVYWDANDPSNVITAVTLTTPDGFIFTSVATPLSPLTVNIANLTPGTTYMYQAIVQSGVKYYPDGAVKSFTTSLDGAIATPTPGPATPTAGTVKVQFDNSNTAATNNTIYSDFQLVNTGSNPTALSNVTMRYLSRRWHTSPDLCL